MSYTKKKLMRQPKTRFAKDIVKDFGKLLDNKKYKTAHFVEEIWDSFQENKKQVLSQSFERSVKRAFDEVDLDDSGNIDRSELYAGILLLYHNINMIPWGGTKPPPKRQFVMSIFDEYLEIQRSETGSPHDVALSYKYFSLLCKEHFEFIISSVLKRIVVVTFIFPFVAWLITAILMASFLGSVIGDWDDFLRSMLLATMVFVFPYIENLVLKRINSDETGFAEFQMAELKSRAIAAKNKIMY